MKNFKFTLFLALVLQISGLFAGRENFSSKSFFKSCKRNCKWIGAVVVCSLGSFVCGKKSSFKKLKKNVDEQAANKLNLLQSQLDRLLEQEQEEKQKTKLELVLVQAELQEVQKKLNSVSEANKNLSTEKFLADIAKLKCDSLSRENQAFWWLLKLISGSYQTFASGQGCSEIDLFEKNEIGKFRIFELISVPAFWENGAIFVQFDEETVFEVRDSEKHDSGRGLIHLVCDGSPNEIVLNLEKKDITWKATSDHAVRYDKNCLTITFRLKEEALKKKS